MVLLKYLSWGFLFFFICLFLSAGKGVGGLDLKYLRHTAKKLKMQRIFLTEKKEGEASTGQPDCPNSVQCNIDDHV